MAPRAQATLVSDVFLPQSLTNMYCEWSVDQRDIQGTPTKYQISQQDLKML